MKNTVINPSAYGNLVYNYGGACEISGKEMNCLINDGMSL